MSDFPKFEKHENETEQKQTPPSSWGNVIDWLLPRIPTSDRTPAAEIPAKLSKLTIEDHSTHTARPPVNGEIRRSGGKINHEPSENRSKSEVDSQPEDAALFNKQARNFTLIGPEEQEQLDQLNRKVDELKQRADRLDKLLDENRGTEGSLDGFPKLSIGGHNGL